MSNPNYPQSIAITRYNMGGDVPTEEATPETAEETSEETSEENKESNND